MKITVGGYYWAVNGRPLKCDGRITHSNQAEHVGAYLLRDLASSQSFLADCRGHPLSVDRIPYRVHTVLHPVMARELAKTYEELGDVSNRA